MSRPTNSYLSAERDATVLRLVYGLTGDQAAKVVRLAHVGYIARRNRTKRRWSDDRQRRVRAMHTAYPHRRRG